MRTETFLAAPPVKVIRVFDGLDPAGLRAVLADVAGPGAWRPELPVLIDVRPVAQAPDRSEAERIAEVLAEGTKAGVRLAVLAAPGASYGVARMIGIMAENRGGGAPAFLEPRAAVRWLAGHPEPSLIERGSPPSEGLHMAGRRSDADESRHEA